MMETSEITFDDSKKRDKWWILSALVLTSFSELSVGSSIGPRVYDIHEYYGVSLLIANIYGAI